MGAVCGLICGSPSRQGGLRGRSVLPVRSWPLSLFFYLWVSEQVLAFRPRSPNRMYGLQTLRAVIVSLLKSLLNSLRPFFSAAVTCLAVRGPHSWEPGPRRGSWGRVWGAKWYNDWVNRLNALPHRLKAPPAPPPPHVLSPLPHPCPPSLPSPSPELLQGSAWQTGRLLAPLPLKPFLSIFEPAAPLLCLICQPAFILFPSFQKSILISPSQFSHFYGLIPFFFKLYYHF